MELRDKFYVIDKDKRTREGFAIASRDTSDPTEFLCVFTDGVGEDPVTEWRAHDSVIFAGFFDPFEEDDADPTAHEPDVDL